VHQESDSISGLTRREMARKCPRFFGSNGEKAKRYTANRVEMTNEELRK
jgi:hypothetical protein